MKNNMKKIIMLLFCLICLTALTACGQKTELKNSDKVESINTEEDTSKEENENNEEDVIKQEDTNKEENTNTNTNTNTNKNENTSKQEDTTTEKCTPKKFSEAYKYVYETLDECTKESQNTAFFDITDNVDDRVFTVNCDEIVDSCGTTWYGVSYNIYDPEHSDREDGVVIVHY